MQKTGIWILILTNYILQSLANTTLTSVSFRKNTLLQVLAYPTNTFRRIDN
jgi:hypothetical protein